MRDLSLRLKEAKQALHESVEELQKRNEEGWRTKAEIEQLRETVEAREQLTAQRLLQEPVSTLSWLLDKPV